MDRSMTTQPEQLVEQARHFATSLRALHKPKMSGNGPERRAADCLDRLATALSECLEQRDRAVFIAQHLFEMVPREVWREHGVEMWGHYEGDYHAEQVREELQRLAQPPSEADEGSRNE